MPLWQRLGLTLVAIVVASIIAGLIWHRLFGFGLPSYLGGVIGGMTAVPVWGQVVNIGSEKVSIRLMTGQSPLALQPPSITTSVPVM